MTGAVPGRFRTDAGDVFRRAMLESAIGMCIVDREGRFVEVNPALCAFFGRTADDLVTRTWQELTHPDDVAIDLELVGRVLDGTITHYRLPKRYLHDDGHVLYGDLAVSGIRDSDGAFQYFVSQIVDETDRTTAERALRQSEERYHSLIRLARDIVLLIDPSGRIVEANDAALAAYGYSTDEMRRLAIADLRAPATLPSMDDELALAGRPKGILFETEHRRSDGTTFPVEVSSHVVEIGGVPCHQSIVRDISERRAARAAVDRARAELEEARTIANLGMWRRDLVTGQVTWSPQIFRSYGVDPSAPPPSPAEIDALLTPESLAGREAAIDEAARTGQPAEYELEIHGADGETRWLLQRVVVERDEGGSITAYHGTAVDITRTRRAEAALAESEERYRILAENAADVVFRATNDGRVAWISDAVTALTGLRPADLVGTDFAELIHADDVPILLDARAAVLAGEPRRFEVRVRAVDGRYRPVSILLRPLFDEAGRVVGRAGGWHDIGPEVAAREAVRASEAHLRAITESALEAIVTAADDGTIADWNAGAASMFGYAPSEAIGQPMSMLLPESMVAEHAAALTRFRTTTDRHVIGRTIELEARRRDGSLFPIELSLSEWRGPEGHFATAIIRDITERRTAEVLLREREAELQEAQRLAHVGSWQWAPVGDVVEWTDELFRIFGLEPSPTAPSYAAQQDRFPPESRARLNADIERAVESGIPYETPVDIVRPDGEVRHAIAHGEVVPREDGALRLRGTLADVTELRRAETTADRARAELLEAQRVAHVGSWTWDAATDQVEWTDEQFRIFGLEPSPTAPTFTEQARLLAPGSHERLATATAHSMETGEGYAQLVEIVRPDGEHRFGISRAEPFRDTAGDVVGLRGTLADVTEQRAMEARLAESLRLEAVGRLAGGVAHDFNNALMAINGTAEMMAADLPEDDPMRIDLDAIRESGRRAATLAKQLQAFGRRQTLRPTEIDLGAFLREMTPILRRTLGHDLEVRTETHQPGPVVLVDRARLEEIVLALSLNARESMPGGGTLTLASSTAEATSGVAASHPGLAPGLYGCLSVTDSGPAIGPEALAHLFEPFYSTTQMGRGSGLGLAAVQGIVAQSGGSIAVAGAPDGGTTFTVLLPLAPGRADEADEALGRVRQAAAVETSGRILLVEDEPAVRSGVSRMLRRLGHVVYEASDAPGAAGLPDEELERLDILVTDALMPDMDGGTLARRLRERRPGLPVLFVSGYAPDEALQRQLVEPCTAFLAKPFDLDALDAAVRSLIPEAAASRGPAG